MKKNFKMRILVTLPFILIFVFVGTNFILSSARKEIQIVSAEGKSMPLTIKDKIERAKKIWKIETLSKQSDVETVAELKQFLKNKDKGIRKTAAWITRDNSTVQPYFQYLSGREESYQKLKENIAHLSKEETKEYLLNYLFGFKNLKEYTSRNFAEYESAAILLIEIGNGIVPNILELLDNSNNIPLERGNSWEEGRGHKYNFMIILLKSIPDPRSIPKLEELSKSNIKYVSEKAIDALEWVRSGVPYPFQYERILFAPEDDIYPE